MPRLGGDPPREAHAYATTASVAYTSAKKSNLVRVLGFVVMAFLLRNMLFRDYRQDAVDELAASGMNPEQIAKYIPKTMAEKEAYADSLRKNHTKMIEDVAYLLNEVHELKEEMAHLRGEKSEKTQEAESRTPDQILAKEPER